MPRPVVPSLALPRKPSLTLSSARWYGMIRCALALIRSRSQLTPRASRASISSNSTFGSMTTPLPITGVTSALVPDDVLDAVPEQVGRLALTLVAPLGTDQHDRGHLLHAFHTTKAPGGASATGALA